MAESAATEACGSLFSVVMKSAGNNKLAVIKAVRAAIDEDLAKVKDMIDNLPAVIAQGLNKTEAESMARPLTAIGAEIEIV